ncbi:unnamed protein product, partial [Laminaria digitata]
AAAYAAAAAADGSDSDSDVDGADSEDTDNQLGGDDDEIGGGAVVAARGPNGRNDVYDRSSTLAAGPGGDGTDDRSRDEPSPPQASPPRATDAAGGIKDSLDPGLLSCLGRECEGIIDAALHVVLGEQLLRSPPSSGGGADGNPPEAAGWEDVLSTMSRCSKRARRACPKESDPSVLARGE